MASISIKISPETKKKLDELRHQGQIYDGIIRELIEKAEQTIHVKPKGSVLAVKPKKVTIKR